MNVTDEHPSLFLLAGGGMHPSSSVPTWVGLDVVHEVSLSPGGDELVGRQALEQQDSLSRCVSSIGRMSPIGR